jgi:hypothetical protein
MYCMTLLFAILCILALLGLVCRVSLPEVSTVIRPESTSAAVAAADAVEARQQATVAGDFARIRAAGSTSSLAAVVAAESVAAVVNVLTFYPQRLALLAHVDTVWATDERRYLARSIEDEREDIARAVAHFARQSHSPMLAEVVSEIVSRVGVDFSA